MVPKPTPRTPLHPLSPSATQNLPTLPPLASRHTPQKPKQTSGPSRIQDYEVGRLLGRGGFGYVYYARCQKGGEYAIKMVGQSLKRREGEDREDEEDRRDRVGSSRLGE